jgi:hypothetical protein
LDYKRQQEKMGQFWSYPFLRSLLGGLLYPKHFDSLQNFVLFLGYPRSGHSLIGSIIDAHPNAVVSNELDALSFIEQNYSRIQLFYLIRENTVKLGKKGRNNSGYDYVIPNQWQGRHKAIQLIGDKRGGASSRRLHELQSLTLLKKTKEVTQLPLKIIHVVRNPFDNITTMVNRNMKTAKDKKLPAVFESRVNSYFTKAAINQRVLLNADYEVHTMHLEELNRMALQELFDFLSLSTTPDFLDDCVHLLWPTPNRSSQKVGFWSPERIATVSERMASYPHLARYQFGGIGI